MIRITGAGSSFCDADICMKNKNLRLLYEITIAVDIEVENSIPKFEIEIRFTTNFDHFDLQFRRKSKPKSVGIPIKIPKKLVLVELKPVLRSRIIFMRVRLRVNI
jgi:hypothetical protein